MPEPQSVYVVTNAEPDVAVDSVWLHLPDAMRRCGELAARWPGMGYYVLSAPFNSADFTSSEVPA